MSPAIDPPAARRFRGDDSFSATDLAETLADTAQRRPWIESLLAEARRQLQREGDQAPGEAFVFSRIMHSLGSAVMRLADRPDALPAASLPDLADALGPEAAEWVAGPKRGVDAGSTLRQWAEDARALAFAHLQRKIAGSGHAPAEPPKNALRSDEIVWGRAPARLDLAGGWTDTPPFSLERGGCVLNAAVTLNGQPPIQVYARVTPRPLIRLHSIDVGSDLEIRRWEDLLDFGRVDSEFSLVKAALALSGFTPGSVSRPEEPLEESLLRFGGGLEITTLAAIPKGSGLGTSSIMGAAVLAVVHRVLGRELSPTELFHAVLRLEQTLTTGGGWQDQIGGSIGGLKLITTLPGMVPEAAIRRLPPDVLCPTANGGSTLLYYTGITRLAKNILQQVVGRYLDRDREAVATLGHMDALARSAADAVAGKAPEPFGRSVDTAWHLNKRLDPSSTSDDVEELLVRVRPHVHGAKLLGAGGGGFLLMVCRSARDSQTVRELLENHPPNQRARFFDFAVSQRGLEVSVC